VPAKQWVHLAGTYDGQNARLFQNGKQVASVRHRANKTPWQGALFISKYDAGPGPQYQVRGKILGVQIYRRALRADEVKQSLATGR
jgi:hypothetical protein